MYGRFTHLITVLGLALAFSGCQPAAPIVTTLDTTTNSELFPYTFHVIDAQPGKTRTAILPADFDHDGAIESVHLFDYPDHTRPLTLQYHRHRLSNNPENQIEIRRSSNLGMPALDDLDNDSIPELVLAYRRSDTLFCTIVNVPDGSYREYPVVVGADRNGDGHWDGDGHILLTADLDGDGFKEILVICDTQRDLAPRAVVGLDGRSKAVRWQQDVSGVVTPLGDCLWRHGDEERLIIGICSKNNRYTVNGTSDSAAWVQCLNTGGTALWQRYVGPGFASVKPRFLDVNNDGIDEIIAQRTYRRVSSAGDTTAQSALLVLDIDGNLLDSVDCHHTSAITTPVVADIGSDGRNELLVPFRDGLMQIYDRELHLIGVILSTSELTPRICRDYTGDGCADLVLGSDDGRLYLLNESLRQVARTDHGGSVRNVPPGSTARPAEMILRTAGGFQLVEVDKTSWTLLFSRYPVLAFLAAFLPLALVLVIVVMSLQKRRRRLAAAYEHRLVEEKYLQAKTIAGGFAHEIRNALFPVRMLLTRMKSEPGTADRPAGSRADTPKRIDAAISRAIDLTDLVGRYATLESDFKTAAVPLASVVSAVLREQQPEIRKLGVATDTVDLRECTVIAHADHLRTIFSNLVRNSLEALEETVSPRLTIRYERDGEWARVYLSDNGCGIEPENRERIFDPFYSTKPATGKGLGLALSRRMAELSGGELRLGSSSTAEDSVGTTMILVLKASSQSR